jgi:hypothetical protein
MSVAFPIKFANDKWSSLFWCNVSYKERKFYNFDSVALPLKFACVKNFSLLFHNLSNKD